jgi:DMSO reductase family type II enzyme chaperone
MELDTLDDPAALAAASRSRLYWLLASTFAFPDEDLHEAIRDGSLAGAFTTLLGELPYEVPDIPAAELAAAPESYVELESEYIRLFDVGVSGPPCPLYGGVYAGDRMKVMEEATRFYNFFHLHLATETRELPDHVTTELEFLHYLTFREAEVRQTGGDTSSLLRAERDFLARHLCKWVPQLRDRLAKQAAAPFFAALVECALAFFRADCAWAEAAAGS